MANHMEAVTKELGLELGEKFKIKQTDGIYEITSDGLTGHDENYSYRFVSDGELRKLLTGQYQVIKLSWKPKNGDVYYYIELYGDPNVYHEFWEDDCYDEQCYEIHNCFRTFEEAKEKFRKILEVLNNEE